LPVGLCVENDKNVDDGGLKGADVVLRNTNFADEMKTGHNDDVAISLGSCVSLGAAIETVDSCRVLFVAREVGCAGQKGRMTLEIEVLGFVRNARTVREPPGAGQWTVRWTDVASASLKVVVHILLRDATPVPWPHD
jgi:hypothetical protein